MGEPQGTLGLDASLETSESERFGYFASVAAVTDDVLAQALDEIYASRTYAYLPAASLTVMQPASAKAAGQTLGTLTAFRGGRVQWEVGGIGSLAQDWRVPHLYTDRAGALALWRVLLEGRVDAVSQSAWRREQTRFCPVCGSDLTHLPWVAVEGVGEDQPPFQVPSYETCKGCGTTFGVDWIGTTYGWMRTAWLKNKPLLTSEASACLLRTPTDHPLSASTD